MKGIPIRLDNPRYSKESVLLLQITVDCKSRGIRVIHNLQDE